MKTLQDLTPEIYAKIEVYKKDCVHDLYTGVEWKNYQRKDTVDYLDYVYELGKKERPVVIVANTPQQYRQYFYLLFEKDKYKDIVYTLFDIKNGKIAKNKVDGIKKYLHNQLTNTMSKLSQAEREVCQELLHEIGQCKQDVDEITTDIGDISPVNANKMEKDLVEFKPKAHWLFLTSEYSRVYLMWYKFIKDEFKIETSKAKELDTLFAMVKKSSIAKTFLCDKIVLVLRMPQYIHRNEIGFHCVENKPAIGYEGSDLYYINGRKIPKEYYDKYFSKTLTFNDFVNETNEDIKAGIITLIKENEGNEGLLKFLNAYLVDEKVITHNSKDFEKMYNAKRSETLRLYKTKDSYSFLQDSKGNFNQPYAWIEMACPSTESVYLIDTCPTFTDAVECAKWHRPKYVSAEIDYNWKSFTN